MKKLKNHDSKPLNENDIRPKNLMEDQKKAMNADIEWLKLISLPVHLNMTDDDIEYVIYWVNEFFKDN
jgi:dTDP-4-amino-4,6-dideoxygalactose transaminase